MVGEAGTGAEAVDLVHRLKPDVGVMDFSMPGSGGLEATRRITALGFDTKVLVLTMHAEEEYLIPVLEAGASGYLNKTTADSELGTVLVNAEGLTLYGFTNDVDGEPSCYDDCADAWPPSAPASSNRKSIPNSRKA